MPNSYVVVVPWEGGTCVPSKPEIEQQLRYGLVVRIPGSHPGGPGSIPGNGNPFLNLMVDSLSVRVFPAWICFLHLPVKRLTKNVDEDGIRTHACRAHWISSPTP